MTRDTPQPSDFLAFNEQVRLPLLEICKPLFAGFEFSAFGYTRYFADGSRMVLETNQDWFKFYNQITFDEALGGTDSVQCTMKKLMNRDFYAKPLTGAPKNELHHTLFSLNMWNSISLYLKTAKYVEIFHLSTSSKNEGIIDFYINDQKLLHRFIAYFREKMLDLNLESAPLTTSSSARTVFDELLEREKKTRIQKFIDQTSITKYYLGTHDVFIAKREVECLYHLSLGFSAKEVARAMCISNRTVESYLQNLKLKFGFHTKQELIRLALENNIDSFIPQGANNIIM